MIFRVLLVILMLIVGVLSGCAGQTDDGPTDGGQTPGDVLGSVDRTDAYRALDKIADRTLRFRYLSTYPPTGALVPVSAAVFVPRGRVPAGGWPVLALGHPTTGVAGDCAPSLYGNLLGTVDLVATLLEQGFVVVQTDYQGLGTPSAHAFLEPTVAANNIIDSVRAARAVVEGTSDKWWGFGVSQGGHAVFRANEIADSYGRGLDLVGTVSMSPALDLRPLADSMAAGTLTTQQIAFIPLLLTGLKTVHPELNIDDYVRGPIRETFSVFLECNDAAIVQKQTIIDATRPDDLRPVDQAATDRLRAWLAEASLPQDRASAPMLIAYSTADEVIDPAWTASAIEQACRQGDVIAVTRVSRQAHGILDIGSSAADWVRVLRSGGSAPNSCR